MRRSPIAISGTAFSLAAAALDLLEVGLVVGWSELTSDANPFGPQEGASSLILFLC